MPRSLSISRAIYLASYVAAAAVAAGVVLSVSASPLVAATYAGAAATLLLYALSLAFKNSGFYDCYWSVAPVACAVGWLYAHDAWTEPRAVLATLVTAAWGIRLTVNWTMHFQGLDHEDWRYVDLRERTGGSYWIASFFALHVFPFTLVTLGTWPLHEAIASRAPLGALDVVALVTGLAAVVIEARSDIELHRFRRENRDPARFLETGLWAYSRHPNYFGEMLVWWALAGFGLAARLSPPMVLGALGVTGMILFASIPMAEARALAKRPHFAEYQRRVSRLVPWFRRS